MQVNVYLSVIPLFAVIHCKVRVTRRFSLVNQVRLFIRGYVNYGLPVVRVPVIGYRAYEGRLNPLENCEINVNAGIRVRSVLRY